jgi:hypothetical protein
MSYERLLARALRSRDPGRYARRLGADPDGLRLTALLVTRLRFERLLRGSPEADAWFERDPQGFAATFRRYHEEVPPRAFFPAAEARLFAAWRRSSTPGVSQGRASPRDP